MPIHPPPNFYLEVDFLAKKLKKGEELYGEDMENWKFKCSNCGRIQSAKSIREQMEKGEKSQRWGTLKKGDDFDPSTSCFSPTCNWVSNGLFNSGILVIIDSTKPYKANLLVEGIMKTSCKIYVFSSLCL